MSDLEEYFNCALELTKKAGELILKNKDHPDATTKSSNIDFVTETDKNVEKLLIDGIKSKYPTHKFIGEESTAIGAISKITDEPTWVIDPIDGTMNFVHAFPHSCISIAFFLNSEPQVGIIYNPMLNQLFTAIKGQGAFYNGERMKVSKETSLANSLLMMENGTTRDEENVKVLFSNQRALIPVVRGIRTLGSAALNMSMVALGCADAYFEFGIHIWDIGAGEIILTEAGGYIIDPSGGKLDRSSRRMLCAGTKELAEELSKIITQYYPTPRDDE